MMSALAVVQLAICAWLLIDLVSDHGKIGWLGEGRGEAIASILLFACTLATILACRHEHRRLAQMESQLLTLTSGLVVLVERSFVSWHLTPAESNVALLALKGFETNEIADFRHASTGTVRAQLARVYAKAGVDSRAGLQGLFLDDLMAGLPSDSHEMEEARKGPSGG